jgi:hypothetical protein
LQFAMWLIELRADKGWLDILSAVFDPLFILIFVVAGVGYWRLGREKVWDEMKKATQVAVQRLSSVMSILGQDDDEDSENLDAGTDRARIADFTYIRRPIHGAKVINWDFPDELDEKTRGEIKKLKRDDVQLQQLDSLMDDFCQNLPRISDLSKTVECAKCEKLTEIPTPGIHRHKYSFESRIDKDAATKEFVSYSLQYEVEHHTYAETVYLMSLRLVLRGKRPVGRDETNCLLDHFVTKLLGELKQGDERKGGLSNEDRLELFDLPPKKPADQTASAASKTQPPATDAAQNSPTEAKAGASNEAETETEQEPGTQ